MSDLEIGALSIALPMFLVYGLAIVITNIQDTKYVKKIYTRFEAINNQLSDIQEKLESRG